MKLKKIIDFKWELSFLIFFVASRLPMLGHDIFNTDVWKWKSRIFDFGTGIFTLNFEKTIQRYHPGVTLMWIGSFAVKVYNFGYELIFKIPPPDNSIHTIFQLHFMQKFFIVLAIGFTLFFVFYVVKQLFSLKYALLTLLMMSLEPFYVGLTRVVHLEGLMSTFMIASFVAFYMYIRNSHMRKYIILSAFFGALAILTKTSALFLLPMMALILVCERIPDFSRGLNLKNSINYILVNFLTWLVFVLIFFIALWPAMWTMPQQALSTLYSGISETGVEEGHIQLYFSNLVEDPGLTFYPVVLFLRSSVMLIIGVIGFFLIYKKLNANERKFASYALLFALFYGIEMTIPSKKLDRYLLPSIISLWFTAGFFYIHLLKKIEPFVVGLIILLLLPVFTLIVLHSDYLAYYNPLIGGTAKGIYIIEPKWMIGQHEIVDYLNELKTQNAYASFEDGESIDEYVNTVFIQDKLVVGFQEKYYTQIWPFVNEIGARATITDLTGQAINTKYFIYPVWDDTSHEEDRFELVKVGEIESKGIILYHVYERIIVL